MNHPHVVVASTGGAFVDAQRAAFFDPFTAETGIDVTVVPHDGTMPRVRDQVAGLRDDAVDVVFLAPVEAYRAEAEGLAEPFSLPGVSADTLRRGAVTPTSMAAIYSALVLVWNTRLVRRRLTIKDLFDPGALPGVRAIRATGPAGVLEMALLADGVPKAELYPLDLDRAFAVLERIRGHLLWYDTYDEGTALIATGQAGLGLLANGRAYAAVGAGHPVGSTYDGSVSFVDRWVIPRGAPNHEQAEALLAFMCGTEPQRRFGEALAYGGANRHVDTLFSPEAAAAVPTSPGNEALLTTLNSAWWSEHGAVAAERWAALVSRSRQIDADPDEQGH